MTGKKLYDKYRELSKDVIELDLWEDMDPLFQETWENLATYLKGKLIE